jgi:hypothetical protein
MPWPVYSERILHHQASGNWTWTVPEGRRLIITNVAAVNAAGAGAAVYVTVGPVLAYYAAFQAPDIIGNYAAMKVVAYQGELVTLNLNLDGIHTTVTGSLLEDVSGATGPPASASQLPEYPPVLPELARAT